MEIWGNPIFMMTTRRKLYKGTEKEYLEKEENHENGKIEGFSRKQNNQLFQMVVRNLLRWELIVEFGHVDSVNDADKRFIWISNKHMINVNSAGGYGRSGGEACGESKYRLALKQFCHEFWGEMRWQLKGHMAKKLMMQNMYLQGYFHFGTSSISVFLSHYSWVCQNHQKSLFVNHAWNR